MSKEKKIAIIGTHFSWDGGVDFLCYLVNAILFEPKTPVKIFLVLPYNYISYFKSFLLLLIAALKSPFTFRWTKFFTLENRNQNIVDSFYHHGFSFSIIYYNYSYSDLNKKVLQYGIDILLPCIESPKIKMDVPWLGYIPDLQHKHFPTHFTPKEIYKRDKIYSKLLNKASGIIVNSIFVREDLARKYQLRIDNVFCLPFAPSAPNLELIHSTLDVVSKYKLPKKYFLISNQFWKHKSHITAFEALKLLIDASNQEIYIVCTGKLYDDRFPEYIVYLKSVIDGWKLDSKIIFLGFIPKADQLKIMQNCIGVIQPTTFEGGPGGGSIYNAISVGANCIISDIKINKEIESDKVIFFESANAASLALKMQHLLNDIPKKIVGTEQLVAQGNARTRALSETLHNIIDLCIQKKP